MAKRSARMTVTAKGYNFFGEEKAYAFQLMPTFDGLDFFHEHMEEIVSFCEFCSNSMEDDSTDAAVVAIGCRQVLDPPTFKKFRMNLLAGFKEQDPFEVYAALYHALIANYGPTLTPLLEALNKQGDSDQTTTEKPANQPSE